MSNHRHHLSGDCWLALTFPGRDPLVRQEYRGQVQLNWRYYHRSELVALGYTIIPLCPVESQHKPEESNR